MSQVIGALQPKTRLPNDALPAIGANFIIESSAAHALIFIESTTGCELA
jgi:hypothetical protein